MGCSFIKPMLAETWNPKLVQFPVLGQPKIDGVRAWTPEGTLLGRSRKEHRNRHITEMFSQPGFAGFDGEMACGGNTSLSLCRDTSSALARIEGEPDCVWNIFDYIGGAVMHLPYVERHRCLTENITELWNNGYPNADKIRIVSYVVLNNMDELEAYDAANLDAGYEGTIFRNPLGMFKQGRSTAREGGLMRIKRFVQEEAVVQIVEEGQRNDNVAIENELGHTSRSTHAENMVPNGMVGSLVCSDVKTGQIITVAAGRMTHAERLYFFQNQNELIGKTISYKTFVPGKKDLPRFPTFQHIRIGSDIGV